MGKRMATGMEISLLFLWESKSQGATVITGIWVSRKYLFPTKANQKYTIQIGHQLCNLFHITDIGFFVSPAKN